MAPIAIIKLSLLSRIGALFFVAIVVFVFIFLTNLCFESIENTFKSMEYTLMWFKILMIPKGMLLFKKNFFYVYLFLRERERQNVSRAGAEREGDTESKGRSRL